MHDSDGISGIVGMLVKNVRLGDGAIYFDCENVSFRAYHMQDCCEHVRIFDIDGNLKDLEGFVVASAEESISNDWPSDVERPKYIESFTWTTHTFTTEASTVVTVRWLGESNGYYSENVYFERTHSPVA